MSVTLRYYSTSTGSIEENLIGFLAVTETTGEYLTNAILGELEKHGLDIHYCRGQGYDNDTNMVGINRSESYSRVTLESKTRAMGDGPRNFEPRSSNEDDT
ncbi:TTF-type domain-containing protein [Trichonephila clavipes]|nr:TTF-type domain-containing protein [Trichonephila clavipes]